MTTTDPRTDQDRLEGVKPTWRGWIHFCAFCVTLALSGFVISLASTTWDAICASVFFIGLAAMFGTSALFHLRTWGPVGRRRMRRADHTMIFVAIAGSYTGICGIALSGWTRVLALSIVWAGAILGATFRQIWLDAPKWAIAIPYVVVGWSALLFTPQLFHVLGAAGFFELLAGGLAYTVGAIFYSAKRPNPVPGVFGYHELFHSCTVVGAGFHLAIVWQLLA
jgi:hemolysin III